MQWVFGRAPYPEWRAAALAALVAALRVAIPAGMATAAKKSAHGVRLTAPKNGAIIPRNTASPASGCKGSSTERITRSS